MEQDENLKIEQIEEYKLNQKETVGFILKQKRRELKFSLDDVSSHLKIKKFYLDAIENNEFSNLPGNTYTIGFIKSYASFLKLDQKKLVEIYKYMNNTLVDQNKDEVQDENVVIKDPVFNTNHLILALLVVLFILIVVVIVKFTSKPVDNVVKPAENVELLLNSDKKLELNINNKETENNLQDAKEAVDVKENTDVNAFQNIQKEEVNTEKMKEELSSSKEYGVKDKLTARIVLKITKDNWIKLKKDGFYKYDEKLGDIGNGTTVFEGVLKSGDIYYIPDGVGYYLTVGNAQGVDIIVDGKVIEPLSQYEVSRHNIEMNVEKLLNRTAYKKD